MAAPLLIDTDMGIDDAVGVCLALVAETIDVWAIVGVGGNVELEQVTKNISGLLTALNPPKLPVVGRGRDPEGEPLDRRAVFGDDGLGECGLSAGEAPSAKDFVELYDELVRQADGQLVVMTMGPLSNLAAFIEEFPDAARKINRIYIAGGAVWTSGDAENGAEFNFRRDPQAAKTVLSSGLPITIVPLDVTKLVCLDESHVAHLAASGYRTGEILARALRFPMEQDEEPAYGKSYIHAAVAAGSIIWPDLFMKTQMRMEVATEGRAAGCCRPALGGEKSLQVNMLTAVNAVDFIENLFESLCHETFVV